MGTKNFAQGNGRIETGRKAARKNLRKRAHAVACVFFSFVLAFLMMPLPAYAAPASEVSNSAASSAVVVKADASSEATASSGEVEQTAPAASEEAADPSVDAAGSAAAADSEAAASEETASPSVSASENAAIPDGTSDAAPAVTPDAAASADAATPEADEAPSATADFVANEEAEIDAADVQGEATEDRAAAQEALAELDDVDADKARTVAAELLDPEAANIDDDLTAADDMTAADDLAAADDPAATDPEYPRSADGSNIEGISAKWITADTVDNGDPALLYVKPNGDTNQSVRLQINYALSGEHPYEPGDVTITVPAHIFLKRGSDAANYGTLVIPYPEDPSRKNDFNWKLVGDNYVLTNTKRMSAATKGYIQFAIDGLTPHELVDMQESEPFDANIEVVTHLGNTIALRSNELTAVFDTEARVTNSGKRAYQSIERVPASSIPAAQRIEGEETYIKVNWYAWCVTKSNTVYTLDAVDVMPDEYDGFVIGATSEDGLTQNKPAIYQGYNDGESAYYYFSTAYPASQFEPDTRYTFHNTVTFTATEVDPAVGDDPQLVTTTTASAQTVYSYTDPKWLDPRGHFMVVKNGNDDKYQGTTAKYNDTHHKYYGTRSDIHLWSSVSSSGWYGIYPSALNELQDQYAASGADGSVRLSYTVDTVGYVMPWMYDGSNPEYDADGNLISTRKSINYTRPITITTQDVGPSIGRGGAKLALGTDYDYISVEFPEDPWLYTGTPKNINPDGSFTAMDAGDGTFLYTRDSDKSHWPDIQLEALVGGQWQALGTASWKGGLFSFTPASGAAQASRVVDLPAGTQNFRTTVTLQNTSTDAQANRALQAAIDYDLRVNIKFKSTPEVIGIIEQAFEDSNTPEMLVWNEANMTAVRADVSADATDRNIVSINNDGYDSLRGYTTDVGVYPYKTSKQSVRDVDYENRLITIHYTAKVEERSVINDRATYEQAIADGRLTTETHGVWRDLLPKGVTPVIGSITLSPATDAWNSSNYVRRTGDSVADVRTIENFEGTGRTMLIVEVNLTPTPQRYRSGDMYYYEDVPCIAFDATYDFESLKDYGDIIHNVISFESSNDQMGTIPGYTGEPDDPTAGNNVASSRAFADDVERDKMTDLDPNRDTNSFVYAGANTKIDILSAARTSLWKDVMVNNDGWWSDGLYYGDPDSTKRTVYEGGQYAYRLRVMSDPDTISKDLVIYDSLENFYAGDGNDEIDIDAHRWQGTFMGVDTSQLEEMGCAPVVYYSTVEGLELSDETDPDVANTTNTNLTNTAVWVKASEFTGSLADVRAIAVDASKKADGSDFSLQPLESGVVIVRMRAPYGDEARDIIADAGVWGESAQAYNNAYLLCTSIDPETMEEDSGNFVRKDYTKVGLKEYNFEATKAFDDGNDRDGIRPESVTLRLLADGQDTGKTVALPIVDPDTGDASWTAVFPNLPYSDPDGNKIHYTVSEDDVAEGYAARISQVDEATATVTNYHEPERTSVEGVKTWVGDPEDGSMRPATIRVRLYSNGRLAATKSFAPDSDGNWTYRFDNLYKYEKGEEITYTVEEDVTTSPQAASYVPSVDGFDIVNTYHPFGDLRVTKVVENTTATSAEVEFPFTFSFMTGEGDAAEPFTVDLEYDVVDTATGDVVSSGTTTRDSRTVSIKGGQTIHVKDIPQYVTYSVTEEQQPGFVKSQATGDAGTVAPNATQQATFVNTYSAEGRINLPATKVLTGRELQRYQFRFELYQVGDDGTETLVRTAANDKPSSVETDDDGTVVSSTAPVTFGALRYTQDDARTQQETGKPYTYRVKEAAMTKGGYTYDARVYDVDVAITDNNDGTLDVVPTYYDSEGNAVDAVVFENAYEAEGEIVLRAWKDLQGRKLTDGEFTFQVVETDADGKPVEGGVHLETTNAADGSIVFDAIKYDQTDIGKTFFYRITEKLGTDSTVNYDKNGMFYKVSVVDNGDGTLSCSTGILSSTLRELSDLRDVQSAGYTVDEMGALRWIGFQGDTEYGYEINVAVVPNMDSLDDDFWKAIRETHSYAMSNVADGAVFEPSALVYGFYGASGVVYRIAGAPYFNLHVYFIDDVDVDLFGGTQHIAGLHSFQGALDYYVTDETYDSYVGWYGFTIDPAYEILIDDSGENTVPVFTNTLKPGSFAIEKHVTDAEEADPDQEFTFRVKLIGEDMTDDMQLVGTYGTAESTQEQPADDPDMSGADDSSAEPLPEAVNDLLAQVGAIPVLTPPAADAEAADLDAAETPMVAQDDMYVAASDLSGYPAADATSVKSGECGTCVWTIYSDGTFVLSPKEGSEGTLDEFEYDSYACYGAGDFIPWFEDRGLIKRAKFQGTIHANKSLNSMFYACYNMEEIDFAGLDTSSVTNTVRMFSGCGSLSAVDLTGLDLSNLDDPAWMFERCGARHVDMGAFNGKSLARLFQDNGGNLQSIDLSDVDTSRVTSFEYLFHGCSALASVDLSTLNTSNATSMHSMFEGCRALTQLDVSTLDTRNVKYMGSMFNSCTGLTELDLSTFDTSSLTDMSSMFQACTRLKTLDVSSFDTSKVVSMSSTFLGCSSLQNVDVSRFKADALENPISMFSGCSSLTAIDLSSFVTTPAQCRFYQGMFENCSKLQYLDMSGMSNAREMQRMFLYCNALKEVVLGPSFSFKGDPNQYSRYDAELPTPPSSAPYTGKWVRADEAFGPFTAYELKSKYTPVMAGTWVWEGISGDVNVSFTADEGAAGAMASTVISYDKPYTIPACAFVRPGYVLAKWVDNVGNEFGEGATIPAYTYTGGQSIVLTANFEPKKSTVDLHDGEFTITLHGGEKVTFDDIPAGTAYQVYEETPDGWVLVEQKNASGAVEPLETAQASFTNKYTPGIATAQFSGVKTLDGVAAEAGTYTFTLDETTEGASGKVTMLVNGEQEEVNLPYTVSVSEGGFVQFPAIVYSVGDVGTHTYEIAEVDPNSSTVDYDAHVETVKVEVAGDVTALTATTTVDEAGDGRIAFANKTRPGVLKIRKNANVTSNEEFTFKVTLNNAKGLPLGENDSVEWYVLDSSGGVVQPAAVEPPADDDDAMGPADDSAATPGVLAPQSAGKLGEAGALADEPTMLAAAPSGVVAAAPMGSADMADDMIVADDGEDDMSAAADDDIASGVTYGVNWRVTAAGELILGNGGTQTFTDYVYRGFDTWPYDYDDDDFYPRGPSFHGGTKGNYSDDFPWYKYELRQKITSVSFDGTVIGSKNMSGLFSSLYRATSIDLTGFDTSNVEVMYQMFSGCSSLKSLDISGLNTSRVRYMTRMFASCSSLVELDITSLNTNVLRSASGMFSGCSSLKELDFSNFNTTKLCTAFSESKSATPYYWLSKKDGSNASNVTNRGYGTVNGILYGCNSLSKITLGTNIVRFYYCNLPSLSYEQWIREDGSGGPYSGSEFANLINSLEKPSTWVKEMRPDFAVVRYNSNGGSLYSTSTKVVNQDDADQSVTLPAEGSVYRQHFTKAGWNTEPDGSGTHYDFGHVFQNVTDLVEFGHDITLYAEWEPSYARNYVVEHYRQYASLDGYTSPEREYLTVDDYREPITPAVREYEKYRSPEPQTVTVAEDDSTVVKYYYDRYSYTVAFDGNGASSGHMDALQVGFDYSRSLPSNLYQKTASIFTGWNTAADGSGTAYGDRQTINNLVDVDGGSVTLYAQWMDNPNADLTPSAGVVYVRCKAGQTVVFPALPDGTTYQVEEVDVPDGWTLTSSSNVDGTIAATVTSTASFTNTYAAEGEISLLAHKKLDLGTPDEGQFTFILERQYYYYGYRFEEVQRVTNGATDTAETIDVEDGEPVANPWKGTAPVEFDALTFTQEDIGKTYTYRIRELRNDDDTAYEYDTHYETVLVTVTDAGKGVLDVTAEYDEDGAVFTNKIEPGQLKISKGVDGGYDDGKRTNFAFTVTLKDAKGNPLEGGFPATRYVLDQREQQAVAYSHLYNVDDEGVMHGGYGNDEWYTDTVSFPKASGLHVQLTYGTETNYDYVRVSYVDASGVAQTSRYTGDRDNPRTVEFDIPNNEVTFTFESDESVSGYYGYYAVVTPTNGYSAGQMEDYLRPEDAGTVSNGSTFTLKAGEEFVIEGLPEGASYKVVEAEREGWELVNAQDDSGSITAGQTKEAVFTNRSFQEQPETPLATAKVPFVANKTLAGGTIGDGEFAFELVDDVTGEVIQSRSTDTAGDSESAITFDPLTITSEGVDYDQDAIDAYVSDLVQEEQSAYEAAKDAGETDAADFESWIRAEKDMSLTEFIAAAEGKAYDVVPMTKTLTYTVREVAGDDDSIIYDANTYVYKVVASYNGTDTLDTDVTSWKLGATSEEDEQVDAVEFVNVREPVGEIPLTATKVLEGRDFQEGDAWTFTVTPVTEGAPLPVDGRGAVMGPVTIEPTSGAEAPVELGTLKFALADLGGAAERDFEYKVAESGEVPGVDNDPRAERTVVVHVADSGSGPLAVALAEGSDDLTWTNRHAPVEPLIQLEIPFSKALYGGDGTESFEFRLAALGLGEAGEWPVELAGADLSGEPEAGSAGDDGETPFVLAATWSASDGAEHGASFPAIGYDRAGTYYYAMGELDGGLPGVAYDQARYLVRVTVAEAAGGALEVEAPEFLMAYPDGAGGWEDLGGAPAASFANTKSPVSLASMAARGAGSAAAASRASVFPEVRKVVDGGEGAPLPGEFSFELHAGADPAAEGSLIATASNDASGRVAFFESGSLGGWGLVYDEPGTWEYSIVEVAGADPSVSYDPRVIRLTVTVSREDASDPASPLRAELKYSDEQGNALADPLFDNSREGADLVVYKVSRAGGEGLAECTYALWMVGAAGDVMLKEATSDESGRIVFKDVALAAGQRYYLKEVEAPSGHTVDPYRTAYFALSEDGTSTVLAEEVAADGWHSKYDNIELDGGTASE